MGLDANPTLNKSETTLSTDVIDIEGLGHRTPNFGVGILQHDPNEIEVRMNEQSGDRDRGISDPRNR